MAGKQCGILEQRCADIDYWTLSVLQTACSLNFRGAVTQDSVTSAIMGLMAIFSSDFSEQKKRGKLLLPKPLPLNPNP